MCEPLLWFHLIVTAPSLRAFKRVFPHFFGMVWSNKSFFLINSDEQLPPPAVTREEMNGVLIREDAVEVRRESSLFHSGPPFCPGTLCTLVLSSVLEEREMKLEVGLYTPASSIWPVESSPLAHQSTENGQSLVTP